jgi:acyl carrier protein
MVSAGCGREAGPPPVPAIKASERGQGDLESEVIRVLAEQFNKKPEAISLSLSLHDLGADELDLVELVMELEDTFDVTIADKALEQAAGTSKMEDILKGLNAQKLVTLVMDARRTSPAGSKASRLLPPNDVKTQQKGPVR